MERRLNNKRITTTESLQKRFFNGRKNHVMEIEKLMCHHSATKERINFRIAMFFFGFFMIIRNNTRRIPILSSGNIPFSCGGIVGAYRQMRGR